MLIIFLLPLNYYACVWHLCQHNPRDWARTVQHYDSALWCWLANRLTTLI